MTKKMAGALSIALACAFLLIAQSALADTFTLLDLTNQVTVTSTNSLRVGGLPDPQLPPFCFAERCDFSLLPPSSTAFVTATTFSVVNSNIFIADAGNNPLISDILQVDVSVGPGEKFVFVDFSSGFDLTGPCTLVVGGCQIAENGKVQTAGTISWSDGTVDKIRFQSDAKEVPEPASITLVLIGFAVLGTSKLRGRMVSRG